MKFNYSTQTRILYVFGGNMTHIFQNVNESEITDLVANAKFKESIWRK
ncbi:hypothetical protein F902_01381 [Acinetobacter higginsii]|uniref:Uncharacterized protein n=2 Tax=Acinetobacter TaxID=469 RepID=R9B8B2_9GAMM|nr:hypothetical protein F902_01381 [Acinetobacter higginsii]EOR08626.1 hypothetical protein F896_01152 [Acinetobacter genomosp. 15BJ]